MKKEQQKIDNSKIICRYITPYICDVCSQDTLFFITKNNVLIDYKSIINKGLNRYSLIKYLQDKNIKYIKCINCNKTYIIDWRTGYPKQLLDGKLLPFNNQ